MSSIEIGWYLACGATGLVGKVLVDHARYLDGDRDAHSRRHTEYFRAPGHPYAVKAWKRGLRLIGLAMVMAALGLVFRVFR